MEKAIDKRRCAAMIAGGIYSATSQDGIDFCVNYCPYDWCVVMEFQQSSSQSTKSKRVMFAQRLRIRRVSVEDIALIMQLSQLTVRRYLKK